MQKTPFIIIKRMEKVKTLIIGSGPAGYTAAIYAGRANLQPVLYSGMQPGGQLTTTTIVENFPGFHDGIDANQLMMEMRQQAETYGADVRDGSIVKADLSSRPFHIEDERGNVIEADTLIIATGASAKYLGLPDEEKYRGQGVSACATCDGFFYRKRVVAVVGGGDIVSSLLEEDAVGTEEIDFIVDPKKACAHERSVLSVFPHKVRGW